MLQIPPKIQLSESKLDVEQKTGQAAQRPTSGEVWY